jgi:hypothetical protein
VDERRRRGGKEEEKRRKREKGREGRRKRVREGGREGGWKEGREKLSFSWVKACKKRCILVVPFLFCNRPWFSSVIEFVTILKSVYLLSLVRAEDEH